jgi:hypothetical protein
MRRRGLTAIFCCLAMLAAAVSVAFAGEELGPWRPKSCTNLQVFGAAHFVDHADLNHYVAEGNVRPFGLNDYENYSDRLTPLYGLRVGMVFNRIIMDLQGQYYREWRGGTLHDNETNGDDTNKIKSQTGAMISGVHFLMHFGIDLLQTRNQLYPFVGLGWSYTNLVVNGDDHRLQRFPDFAGAKEGVPADVGIGFEMQNPIWTSDDSVYRTAFNLPVFIHVGYQGEIITYFWQVKHGNLERSVSDRFMGPYARIGIGFGKGKYLR